MVRCSESGGEVVVALLRSFSPRERPEIVLSADGAVTRFRATVVPPGAALLLPVEATALINGPWRSVNEIAIKVEDPQGVTSGVVQLEGLAAAYRVLMANCGAPGIPAR
jgi:hypothetical protein